jgi:hypothetical protein
VLESTSGIVIPPVTTLALYAQIFLLGIGVVLSLLWVREPEKDYDIWLGASVAVLAVLEFVKRRVEEPNSKPEKKVIAQTLRDALNAQKEAEKRAAEEERLLAEQKKVQPPPPTQRDIEIARFTKIISLRSEVESRLRSKGIDDTGRSLPNSWPTCP